jgi:hypothetical protein
MTYTMPVKVAPITDFIPGFFPVPTGRPDAHRIRELKEEDLKPLCDLLNQAGIDCYVRKCTFTEKGKAVYRSAVIQILTPGWAYILTLTAEGYALLPRNTSPRYVDLVGEIMGCLWVFQHRPPTKAAA